MRKSPSLSNYHFSYIALAILCPIKLKIYFAVGLKIAMVASVAERIPPKKYGGTERVVHTLTEELVRRGHDITLFASGDAQTSAKLAASWPRSLRDSKYRDPYGINIPLMLNIGSAYDRQDEFDIIHDHTAPFCLPTANIARIPTVLTYHGPFTPEMKRIFERLNKPNIVTISKNQGKRAPNINKIATVYNGLEMEDFPFNKNHKGYLLFVGRISMEKGVHRAIDVAHFLDMPLIIAAKLDPVDMAYFNEYVGPSLSDEIQWIGEVDEAERNKLMSEAYCFLHPITWPEPFGLTLIESMACGCPVIAIGLGSIPEIIKHGKTGFVAKNTDDIIEYVTKVNTIDRTYCRAYALEKFSGKAMATGYERVYKRTIARWKKRQ